MARGSISAVCASNILCSLILSTITSNFVWINKSALSVTRFSPPGARSTSTQGSTRKKRPDFAWSVMNHSPQCQNEALRHTWTSTWGNRRVSLWPCALTVVKSLKRKRTWTTTWPTTTKTTPSRAHFLPAPKPLRTGLASGNTYSAMVKKRSSARCVAPNSSAKLGWGDTCRSIMGSSFAARNVRTDSAPTMTWNATWRLFTRASGSFHAALAIQSFIQAPVWRFMWGGFTRAKSRSNVNSAQPSFSWPLPFGSTCGAIQVRNRIGAKIVSRCTRQSTV